MMRVAKLMHKFITTVPEKLEDGVLYVSLEHRSAMHKCCCGCGHEVVTPFSPTDWKMTFDGASISLYPSIGNWSLPCQSHYWIDDGTVRWSYQMTQSEIEAGRMWDRVNKARYYGQKNAPPTPKVETVAPPPSKMLWQRVTNWLTR
jgi:hypothetical protein